MSLSLYEQETIINYSYADAEATIFTYDRALISRLDRYRKKNPEIELLREEKTGAREYRVPKSWISVRPTLSISPEERERRKRQGKDAYAAKLRKQAERRAENTLIGEEDNSTPLKLSANL